MLYKISPIGEIFMYSKAFVSCGQGVDKVD